MNRHVAPGRPVVTSLGTATPARRGVELVHRLDVLVAAARKVDQDDAVLAEPGRPPQGLGQRVRALERREDTFGARESMERLDRLGVRSVRVLDASLVTQPHVLGADRRIVEARRHRMRVRHLAVLVLQHQRARAVEDAETAAVEARGVLAETPAGATRLDAEQSYLLAIEERREDTDRVRAAA